MNLKLREAVFRKIGYEWNLVPAASDENTHGWGWTQANSKALAFMTGYTWVDRWEGNPKPVAEKLPPIEEQWEVTAKYLVPFMRDKGYKYNAESDGYFWWVHQNSRKMWVRDQGAEIKQDNDLALVACKVFMGVKDD